MSSLQMSTLQAAAVHRAAAPLADRARRSDIQGLRAVAVLLVVAFHAKLPMPGGFIGVDIFFVISGFVITSMLVRQLNDSGKLSFALFYARRMRRLLPALAVLTTVTMVVSPVLLSPLGPQSATAHTGIAASIFLANVELSMFGGHGYFDLAAETNAMLHTWSLSVEEQFYFVFPTLLFLGWRAARRRGAAWFILAATVISFAYSCYATYYHAIGVSAFYSPATRAWEFSAGSLLALTTPMLLHLSSWLAHVFGVAGMVLIGLGAFTITDQTPFPGLAALLPVIGTGLILVAGTATDRGISALLSTRLAARVGDVSYSWYLWHWPPLVFAAALWPGNKWVMVVVAAGTLIPAWLSFRFIEDPIRSNQRITGRRAAWLVVVCVIVPVLACGASKHIGVLETQTPTVKKISDAVRFHAPETRPGCQTFEVQSCIWPADNPRGTVFLVGDSNASQFTEPLAAAANREGYDLAVTAKMSCPFVDLIAKYPYDTKARECHQFVMQLVEALRTRRPALVIVANASSLYVENDGITLTQPDTAVTATTPETKAQLWGPGLASVLKPLGVPTVVIHTIPHFGHWQWDWNPAVCPAIRMYTNSCPTGHIKRRDVELQQQRARDAEDQAIAHVPGVVSDDLTNELCSTEACDTDRYVPWLYRDATHLSVAGALYLTDRFRKLITAHA